MIIKISKWRKRDKSPNAREFQIIHRDNPPSRKGAKLPPPLNVNCT